MAETATRLANKIAWVDLASKDAEGSRTFYGSLFGWDVQVNPDPMYGGYALAPPFPVGEQGTMAVFQDPTGAFISSWQGTQMGGFQTTGEGAFAWAELNTRGIDQARSFYGTVFGWTYETMAAGQPGMPDYTTFYASGERVAGAMPMDAAMPADVPSYWMPYFGVADIDGAFEKAKGLGAQEMVAPTDFPGGRFAIVSDPQGAMFGLLRLAM
jgi:predicted enzyme related to lactoylglutathione lyase